MPRSIAGTRTVAGSRFVVKNFEKSLGFNGTSTRIDLAEAVGLPLFSNTNASISLWFKNRSLTQLDKKIFADGNAAGTNATLQISTGAANGRLVRLLARRNDNTIILNSTTSALVFRDDEWHNLVLTDANGSLIMYLDSAQIHTASYSKTTFTPENSTIGAIRVGASETASGFFNGLLDDIRLYSKTLSPTEVSNLYYKGIDPGSQIAWYKLDEGSGTEAVDSSGNANTGTITGGTYSTDIRFSNRLAA